MIRELDIHKTFGVPTFGVFVIHALSIDGRSYTFHMIIF